MILQGYWVVILHTYFHPLHLPSPLIHTHNNISQQRLTLATNQQELPHRPTRGRRLLQEVQVQAAQPHLHLRRAAALCERVHRRNGDGVSCLLFRRGLLLDRNSNRSDGGNCYLVVCFREPGTDDFKVGFFCFVSMLGLLVVAPCLTQPELSIGTAFPSVLV